MLKHIQLYFVLDVSRHDMVESVIRGVRRGIETYAIYKPLKVRFLNNEDGVDHGGVQIELFRIIGGLICDPYYGLFAIDNESQLAWFWSGCFDEPERFEIIGSILALAAYNGCTISTRFPRVLFMKLVGQNAAKPSDIDDLFPTLARGLTSLLNYEGDVEELGLTFEYTYVSMTGTVTSPMSSDTGISVTNENRKTYVEEYIYHLTDITIRPFFDAFKRGWNRLIPDQLTRLFTPDELMVIVQGQSNPDISTEDLRKAIRYADGYSSDHPAIKRFWKIVNEYTQEEKENLLEFVTASRVVPIVGGVEGCTFVIQRNGPDSDRLPTALTCFGRLLLPEYESKEKMARMLGIAIKNTKGFGLV
ncbi:HECT-domain-containing protein [Dipodascopsis uninucleata]